MKTRFISIGLSMLAVINVCSAGNAFEGEYFSNTKISMNFKDGNVINSRGDNIYWDSKYTFKDNVITVEMPRLRYKIKDAETIVNTDSKQEWKKK